MRKGRDAVRILRICSARLAVNSAGLEKYWNPIEADGLNILMGLQYIAIRNFYLERPGIIGTHLRRVAK